MVEKIMQEILFQAPFGYAHHKLVCNSEGYPEDYIFLDVNPAFEEMTGLKKENIIGKKVTEAIPDIKNDLFDWIDFYGRIALNGGRKNLPNIPSLSGDGTKQPLILGRKVILLPISKM